MSDVTTTATPAAKPAASAGQPPRAAAIVDRNEGKLIGRVIGKELKEAGKEFDRETGEVREQKFDLCVVTLGFTDGPPVYLKLTRKAYDSLRGNDRIEVTFTLGSRIRASGRFKFVDSFVNITGIKRLAPGDGHLQRTERSEVEVIDA